MSLKYEKNDYIVYNSSGICVIDDIQQLAFPLQRNKRNYYILKPLHATEGSKIFVPVDNENLISKIRYVFTPSQLDSFIESAQNKKFQWIDDRKDRAYRFQQTIAEGRFEELIPLVECIYRKKRELSDMGKKLNSADENALQAAERAIRDEFSFSMGIDSDNVGPYIRKKLGIAEKE